MTKNEQNRVVAWRLKLMCPFMVVRVDPYVKITLQGFQRRVNLLAEGDLVELVQDRLVEALTDPVGLR